MAQPFFAPFVGQLGELCGNKLLTAKVAEKIRKGRKETTLEGGLFNDSIPDDSMIQSLRAPLTLFSRFRTL